MSLSYVRTVPVWVLGAVALAACSKTRDAGPPVPASVQLSPANRAFTAPLETQQFTATVRDAQGNVIAGAGVTWSSTNDAVISVSATGLATAQDTGNARVQAAASTAIGSAFVSVGTTGAYAVELRFPIPMSLSRQQVFTNAAARWQTLITGDVPDIPIDVPAGQCPAVKETVDDVIIFATIDSIDGPLGVLAQAGPCYVRDPGFLSIMGRMRFDSADMPMLEAAGQLQDVILHEMGHVLGYGVIWASLGLLADSGTADPYFTGTQARQAFDSIGGTAYLGQKVPVEDGGGPGTRNAHWRESVFDRELMTGFLDAGVANPLSVVSVTSMQDLGYTVNRAASDPFTYPLTALRAAEAGPAIELRDDIAHGPIRILDTRGRVTGILQR